MKVPNAISVDSGLKLAIALDDAHGTRVYIRLDRIEAQLLADSLNEYAGRTQKSYGRGRETKFAGEVSYVTDATRMQIAAANRKRGG